LEQTAGTLKLNIRGLNYNIYRRFLAPDSGNYVVFLHGFCGSHVSFSHIYDAIPTDWNIVAPDLVGHGDTESPAELLRYETEHQAADLREILLHFNVKQPIIAGYSMGGRLALQFAIRHLNSVRGLFLESTTAGIKDSTEAINRVEADKAMARLIIDNFEEFLDTWNNKNVFRSDVVPEKKLENRMINIRKKQNPGGLAHSLLGFGTGFMPPVHKYLKLIKCPVCVLAGESDEKFIKEGLELHEKLNLSEYYTIEKSGHRIHLENPDLYLQKLSAFLAAKC